MIQDYLLNKLKLKDGRELIGIIDYTTTKHAYFFDFTNEQNIDYLLLSIMWKGNHDNMRFSVFCTVYYPEVELPSALLVPQNLIKTLQGRLPDYIKPKQRKRIIRSQSL
jgi:hypothetical protein